MQLRVRIRFARETILTEVARGVVCAHFCESHGVDVMLETVAATKTTRAARQKKYQPKERNARNFR